MKSDLDQLMAARGFDAFIVMGESTGNHILKYMTNGASLSHAMVLKKRGEEPVLISEPMEREEAAKSGLKSFTTTDFAYPDILRETGSYFEAELKLLAALFEHFGIQGTVAVYGMDDPGRAYMLLTKLGEMLPDITLVGEPEVTIFDESYATKSAQELAYLKDAAERTNKVFAKTIDFIKDHRVNDACLVKSDGQPLTVGDVKRFLRGKLAEYGLAEEGGAIFAIGRDAGIPHSRGEDDDKLELGKTIIFDLFPYVMDTGYFHDMTRTLCLGYASEEVQRAYEQTMQAFNAVVDNLRVGEKAGHYQGIVCDVYEEHGHQTPRSHPGTQEGYVHSVGHGLGLQIHARPRFSSISDDTIEKGQVVTIEPGLYYPGRGYGVRIEDTVYIDQDGKAHSLTPYPKDLVVPLE